MRESIKVIRVRAMWRDRYGGPAELVLKEVPVPVPGDGDLLVKVHAAALNRSDWENLTGSPVYARMQSPLKPGTRILGTDLAGEVMTVGKDVQGFSVGDRVIADVMYHGTGTFAEFAVVGKSAPVARIPEGVSYVLASALPQAGTIALQGLRALQPDDHVLLLGGAGATGIFAIQLAKALGARVTAVDSGSKLDFMRGLGADEVIDYRQTDVGRLEDRFDLILDPIAGITAGTARRLLAEGGTYWVVGGRTRRLLATLLQGAITRSSGRQLKVLLVSPASEHLTVLLQKCSMGSLQVPVEAEYGLEDLPLAMKRLGDELACGRLIIRPQAGEARQVAGS